MRWLTAWQEVGAHPLFVLSLGVCGGVVTIFSAYSVVLRSLLLGLPDVDPSYFFPAQVGAVDLTETLWYVTTVFDVVKS